MHLPSKNFTNPWILDWSSRLRWDPVCGTDPGSAPCRREAARPGSASWCRGWGRLLLRSCSRGRGTSTHWPGPPRTRWCWGGSPGCSPRSLSPHHHLIVKKKFNHFIIICRHFKNISNYLVLLDIWRSWDKESVRRILMVKLTFFLRKLKLSPQLTSWHWLEQCLDCSWCQNQLTLLENYQNKKYWKICCCCVQLSLHSLSLPGNIFVRIKHFYFLQFFEGSGRPLDLPC